MEYTGLVQKYPVNRPLTDDERNFQLHQSQRLDIETSSQLCVIRMNSTFMEMVDSFFDWKGFITVFVIASTYIVGVQPLISGIHDLIYPEKAFHWLDTLATFVFALVVFLIFGWLAHFECFRYTHYPIRFNRKTRMVHVFRVDGSTFSVPWDKVFFCIGRRYQARWSSVQGHVLANDGVTVLETFSLPEVGYGDPDRDVLKHFWEYLRRYMEDGPAQLIDPIKAVLPIAEGRESFMFGIHRMLSMNSIVGFVLFLPIYLVMYPGRWLAMHTSKIPQWPQAIEDQCRIEPGDPYVREASMNPK